MHPYNEEPDPAWLSPPTAGGASAAPLYNCPATAEYVPAAAAAAREATARACATLQDEGSCITDAACEWSARDLSPLCVKSADLYYVFHIALSRKYNVL